MSGYKRVNFYELCRLCATNQQKDKTHIFQEEGRKIQLQSKIQSCLSISVCEDDCLPKVVCSKCLRSLEVCYTFRQECSSSETMLSSYFKNFRTTEDFKKCGEVYIKDTAPRNAMQQTPEDPLVVHEPPKAAENVPSFYTLQLPPPEPRTVQKQDVVMKSQQPYMTPVSKTLPKVHNNSCENLSNVVVNANGEVLNIAQLVDFESFLTQAHRKSKINQCQVAKKKEPVVKIDLTNGEPYDTGQKVAPSVKQPPKFAYNQEYYGGASVYAEPSTVNLNVLNQDLNPNLSSRFNTVDNRKESDLSKLHICEICHKNFKRREHLYQHVKLHTGFRPYTCESCNKAFMRKEHLLRHMTSHSGQKNFTCNICEKSFSRNDNLLKHRKTHEKQTSYTCDICQKQFVMKHYYLAHKLTHDSPMDSRCNLGIWGALKT